MWNSKSCHLSLLYHKEKYPRKGVLHVPCVTECWVNTAKGGSATWKPTYNTPASSGPHPGLKPVCAASSAKAGTFVLYYRHSKQRIFVSSSLAVIMKFYYCSGFICLLMNTNVVSLFPTLSASLSRGGFHGGPSPHASCPQLAEQAGPGDSDGRELCSKPGCHSLPLEQSGLRAGTGLGVESSGMGVHWLVWTLGMSEWGVSLLRGQ